MIRSLRVLAGAKQLVRIAEVRPLVEALLGRGYWIDEEVIRFLQFFTFYDQIGKLSLEYARYN